MVMTDKWHGLCLLLSSPQNSLKFAGDNFIRAGGDTVTMAKTQCEFITNFEFLNSIVPQVNNIVVNLSYH